MNYTTRTDSGQNRRNHPSSQRQQPSENQNGAQPEEKAIKVDGFEQVLEMLRIADPQFRESLLRRLGQRDPELARNLRAELGF